MRLASWEALRWICARLSHAAFFSFAASCHRHALICQEVWREKCPADRQDLACYLLFVNRYSTVHVEVARTFHEFLGQVACHFRHETAADFMHRSSCSKCIRTCLARARPGSRFTLVDTCFKEACEVGSFDKARMLYDNFMHFSSPMFLATCLDTALAISSTQPDENSGHMRIARWLAQRLKVELRYTGTRVERLL